MVRNSDQLSPTATGYCGDPGKPSKSELTPTQTIYSEGETVVYKCLDYISLKQYRKCVKGKWMGKHAVCGKAFNDKDVVIAKVYNKETNKLIHEYNTTALLPWTKFGNSFIAERYNQPLRAYGANNYRIELYLESKAMIQLVRISLSVVNRLVDNRIKSAKWNITNVRVSPYRNCLLDSHTSVSPWAFNSTRFDFWFSCESPNTESFEKEITDKSNLVVIETKSDDILAMDLATFILAEQYTNDGNPREPVCGLPEIPIDMNAHVINHHARYALKCAPGFTPMDGTGSNGETHAIFCDRDMKWTGSLPECMPQKTCQKFELSEKHLTEVYLYDRVYYSNDSLWFAIEGTKAHFRCKNEIQIFIGKDVRVCGKDGQWSDSMPTCLDTEKGIESKLNLTTISIIIMLTLIVTFSLSALLVYCVLRAKRMQRNGINGKGLRESNIYDNYETQGLGSYGMCKDTDEMYEMVDEERYADNRQFKRQSTTQQPFYTPMTGGPYKTNYNDKNIYDDCVDDYGQQNQSQSSAPIQYEDSYVVMKMY
ncbi:uncharacterized protein LOC128962718 [Oppia nitens]|uniref:uncharacterized protein LOC128962718 n=1 Tax=Oppia nitens TaxID=1686743 RepID=UPI0023DB0CB3|nr:uncharacterized protein LOC128962718 [Oppia nitens]